MGGSACVQWLGGVTDEGRGIAILLWRGGAHDSLADEVDNGGEVGGIGDLARRVGDRGVAVGAVRCRAGIIDRRPDDPPGPEQRRPAAAEDAGGGEHPGRVRGWDCGRVKVRDVCLT